MAAVTFGIMPSVKVDEIFLSSSTEISSINEDLSGQLR
jgi:hypothetical protein